MKPPMGCGQINLPHPYEVFRRTMGRCAGREFPEMLLISERWIFGKFFQEDVAGLERFCTFVFRK